jgi:hypothetical protein
MTRKNSTPTKRSLGDLRAAQKVQPRSPDFLGKMGLQRSTASILIKQLSETTDDEVICNLAGWLNEGANGKFITVKISPRFASKPKPKGNTFDGIFVE